MMNCMKTCARAIRLIGTLGAPQALVEAAGVLKSPRIGRIVPQFQRRPTPLFGSACENAAGNPYPHGPRYAV